MFRREVFDALVAVRRELHGHQPPAVAARDERAVGIGHEHRSDRAAIDGARQIGLEDDIHPVLQDAGTMPADAHRFPDRTLRAISADEVLRSHVALHPGR
jgi:hypothetical protein